MPVAIDAAVTLCCRSVMRTGKIRAAGASPTTPLPVTGRAAISPASAVPRPRQSPAPPLTTSAPGSTAPSSAGTAATPVSSTATTTPSPRVTGQTCSGAIRCSAHAVRLDSTGDAPTQPLAGTGSSGGKPSPRGSAWATAGHASTPRTTSRAAFRMPDTTDGDLALVQKRI